VDPETLDERPQRRGGTDGVVALADRREYSVPAARRS
jgi:hypothetical protein